MKPFPSVRPRIGIDRRKLLIAGGAGAGLLIGWAVWPRDYQVNLTAAPGETVFNAWLKIGNDGRVIVAVPQAELGQGIFTTLPQIVADELGADWRTVAVEQAPISPAYANRLLAAAAAPPGLGEAGAWAAGEHAARSVAMVTAGSSSIRMFEQPAREAAAGARTLLMMAAAERWAVDWQACDTGDGFVTLGEQRLRFAELAEAAAGMRLPSEVALRANGGERLYGTNAPRIDLPAKVDGSVTYAADIRLPDMAFAAIRQGPEGNARLIAVDRKAADAVSGVSQIVETPGWVAAIANSWWAANRALDALKPRFLSTEALPDSASIAAALADAIDSGEGHRVVSRGDLAAMFEGQSVFSAVYSAAMMPHAAIEPMCATARFRRNMLEIWLPTQAPAGARRAAAAASGLPESSIIIHPTMAGGSFGRKLECDAAAQVAILCLKAQRPVQLMWSRSEDMLHDRYRPPALARLTARVNPAGQIEGWLTRIAAPETGRQVAARAGLPFAVDGGPVAGALPPYAARALAIDHHPADIGLRTGQWRSGPHSYTCFFTECFVDELAHARGMDPLLFRIQSLVGDPALARCLTTAATIADWRGSESGSGQGIACHAMRGSRIAVVADVRVDEQQRIRADRLTAVVDCGRQPNPDIVRQQIEGGLIFGLAGALGNPVTIAKGLAEQRNFRDLGLPVLADIPKIRIKFIPGRDATGGVGEIGVPAVAPAIANAVFALTRRRLRDLPISLT